jgi:hypothetical protein
MYDAELVMSVCFLQETEVSFEAICALPFLNVALHLGLVRGQLDTFAIVEPEVIVVLALDEIDAFSFEGSSEVPEGFREELGEKEEGWALVEALEAVSSGIEEEVLSYVAIVMD